MRAIDAKEFKIASVTLLPNPHSSHDANIFYVIINKHLDPHFLCVTYPTIRYTP
jgi:hypothetical protein